MRQQPVIVRRKADGLYLRAQHGKGRLHLFGHPPRAIGSKAQAIAIIRTDIGDDLDAYEITPKEPRPCD